MLDQLLRPEVQELIEERRFFELRSLLSEWTPPELASLIRGLPPEQSMIVFRLLPREVGTATFEDLPPGKQQELINTLAEEQDRLARLLNDLSPDDRTALLGELPGTVTQRLLSLLSPEEYRVTAQLLGYPEESIGRLMTPSYVAIRPDWTIREALAHIRKEGQDSETLNVIYVIDEERRLIDDLRIRELLLVDPELRVADIMDHRYVALQAKRDQEQSIQIFRDYDRVALPVVNDDEVLLGIVTVDDVLDVLEYEMSEDIHKIGASEMIDEPYLEVSLVTMIRKRAPWLILLFFGQMLTATAMGYFEEELAQALVLAIFIPLIISSGGNSGSQAATLVIRALTTGEVRMRDWWRVMRRELLAGLAIGGILGVFGFVRVAAGEMVVGGYGAHWPLIGLTIGLSLVGVVLWGTLAGALLPILLRSVGADPATSSTPFVATLVDVTGLVIYFTLAVFILSGTLL